MRNAHHRLVQPHYELKLKNKVCYSTHASVRGTQNGLNVLRQLIPRWRQYHITATFLFSDSLNWAFTRYKVLGGTIRIWCFINFVFLLFTPPPIQMHMKPLKSVIQAMRHVLGLHAHRFWQSIRPDRCRRATLTLLQEDQGHKAIYLLSNLPSKWNPVKKKNRKKGKW